MREFETSSFLHDLDEMALELGFTPPKIAAVGAPWDASIYLHEFIEAGYYGDMNWMPEQAHRRQHPLDLWPAAKSAIVVGMNYGPDHHPMTSLFQRAHGNISVYARGADYHNLLKKRLKRLAGWVHQQSGQDVKVFVDTAPLMEKPLAALAGLGWQGKHTNLVSREFGSWLFLGVILSAATLPHSAPSQDHCGSCQACLDICPTNAFTGPRKLDARACISYLTIEHKGHIAKKFRGKMGNRIYGCDDCLAICPWNKYATLGQEAKLHARPETNLPHLADLVVLEDAQFRQLFSGSPIKRTGRDRFIRNVLIAIGNSGDANLIAPAKTKLEDASPLVRAMAVWALAQLLPANEFQELRAAFAGQENDPDVRQEWHEFTD